MKSVLLYTFLLIFGLTLHAQVGIGTTVPDGALDITSTNDGLLIPRVALTSTLTVLPIITGTTSELVYNTATAGDVTPGFYYLSTNTGPWVRLATASPTSDSWLITGNTNIVDGTNFIGTAALTNVDVAFRRNNIAAGKLATSSTSFGVGALNAGATSNSTAFGNNALLLNTANNNVAVGNGTLATNVSGISNTAVGTSALAVNTGSANSAFGADALRANSSGSNNTGIGFESLRFNSSASNNTAIGFEAMRQNTTASNNTGLGYQTLRNNITGSDNTAVGFQALNNNRASFNTAVGTQASGSNFNGVSNTAVGYQALQTNTNGSRNVAIGERSLGRNSGSENTVIGWEAMFGATSTASSSTGIGFHALFGNSGASNTAVGWNSLQGNTTATNNTGVGAGTLNNNTTGTRNTAVGRDAGFAATSSDGTFVGYNAGAYSTGTQNTAVGSYALDGNGGSARSVAIGFNSLTQNTSSNNTAVGYNSLGGNMTGSGNVALGYLAGVLETGSNKLYISNTSSDDITSLIYGEFAPTRILRTNSIFQIGNPAGTGYEFPVARGTVSQILQTDASGVLTWVSPSALTVAEVDPEVSSATANSVPKWNGTTLVDGIITDDGTNVTVAGNTITTNFQMTTGAAANLVLQSDATGNASWAALPNNTIKPIANTGLTAGIYTISSTEYTVRVLNTVSEIRLPDATLNTGKVYIVIGSNAIITSKVFSSVAGSIYDDVTNVTINALNPNERYMVQSDGTDWIVIGR